MNFVIFSCTNRQCNVFWNVFCDQFAKFTIYTWDKLTKFSIFFPYVQLKNFEFFLKLIIEFHNIFCHILAKIFSYFPLKKFYIFTFIPIHKINTFPQLTKFTVFSVHPTDFFLFFFKLINKIHYIFCEKLGKFIIFFPWFSLKIFYFFSPFTDQPYFPTTDQWIWHPPSSSTTDW